PAEKRREPLARLSEGGQRDPAREKVEARHDIDAQTRDSRAGLGCARTFRDRATSVRAALLGAAERDTLELPLRFHVEVFRRYARRQGGTRVLAEERRHAFARLQRRGERNPAAAGHRQRTAPGCAESVPATQDGGSSTCAEDSVRGA